MNFNSGLTRRALAASAFALAAPTTLSAADAEAVTVEIESGKLRGLRARGGVSFKGVPYAADTGGQNRFLAPQPVARWAGVRDALQFGDRAPQGRTAPNAPPQPGAASYSENCCVLNVYTPDLNPNAHRPVLVYFHGGGFRSGAGDGANIDGSALAALGDLVVVTINHRLNVLGYTPLGLIDPDFADAGNVGQLDLIAALQWVRRNIGAFGGSASRVTIAGQSGGGSKITGLLLMPGAAGLFHRTINMSGSSAFGMKPAADREPVIRDFLRRLGVGPNEVRKLQDLPVDQLQAAHNAAVDAAGADDYRPVIDGRHIFHAPLSPQGLTLQAAMPGIMSWTSHEASGFIGGGPERFHATEQQVKARIAAQFGLDAARAAAVLDGYRQDDPTRTPWDVLVAVGSDALVKTPMRKVSEAKAALRQAPVYVSEFAFPSTAEGGRLGAPHGFDIAFAFGNVGEGATAGREAAETSRNQAAIFASFIRTGDPNNPRIPFWLPYEAATRPTLVINPRCRLAPDYRSGDRRIADTLPMQDAFKVTSGALLRAPV